MGGTGEGAVKEVGIQAYGKAKQEAASTARS